MTTDTPYTFTVTDVVNRIIVLSQEDPDFVYTTQLGTDITDPLHSPSCSYLGASLTTPNTGRPCIVGQALQDLGVSREDLAEYEMEAGRDVVKGLLDDHSNPSSEYTFIGLTQQIQDDGHPWGTAVNESRKVTHV